MSLVDMLNPANASEGGVSKREGPFRVDNAEFAVHKPQGPKNPKPGDRAMRDDPMVVLRLTGTWLDPASMEPVLDHNNNEEAEVLNLSLGGNSLAVFHPGMADEPGLPPSDVIDMGDEIGAAGPTLYIVDESAKPPNSLSAIMQFNYSLSSKGWKRPELFTWAPAYKGSIFMISTQIGAKDPKNGKMLPPIDKDRPTPYRVVTQIVRAGYEEMEAASDPVKGAKTADDAIKAYVEMNMAGGDKITVNALKQKLQGAVNSKLKVDVIRTLNSTEKLKAALGELVTVENGEVTKL